MSKQDPVGWLKELYGHAFTRKPEATTDLLTGKTTVSGNLGIFAIQPYYSLIKRHQLAHEDEKSLLMGLTVVFTLIPLLPAVTLITITLALTAAVLLLALAPLLFGVAALAEGIGCLADKLQLACTSSGYSKII